MRIRKCLFPEKAQFGALVLELSPQTSLWLSLLVGLRIGVIELIHVGV